jgi:hypothetical protein
MRRPLGNRLGDEHTEPAPPPVNVPTHHAILEMVQERWRRDVELHALHLLLFEA